MKLLLCFGTRPEAIKMAPVIHQLKKQHFEFEVCVTAQHREMLDQVLEFFEITPDYDLDLMEAGQTLNGLSASIFKKMDEVFDDWLGLRQACPESKRRAQSGKEGLRQACPESERRAQSDRNLVLVHGDTTTASMIALAAFHRGIKVGHVEAGLRTYNKEAPFPEEANRQLTARIADFHFAPTAKAKWNLFQEQIPQEQIFITGNTVVDALQWAAEKIKNVPENEEIRQLKSQLDPSKKMILVTGHRRENFGAGLEQVCAAIKELAEEQDVGVVFPVHLNPKVQEPVQQLLGDIENVHLISPVLYPTMLWLIQKSVLIISDSGGIQEEAPTFKKPVLVTREFSERMEGVEAGYSILVGTDSGKILSAAVEILNNSPNFESVDNPYGDGKAAERIVEVLFSKGFS